MNTNIYLIAEIGINHNGDLKIAKELIKKSKEAGFDAVKFQKRDLDSVYSKEYLDSYRESPWGKTQRDQKRGLEFEKKEYDEIDKYCKQRGISWSASPWDLDSLEFLAQYDIPWIKIPSAMITNKELVKACAETNKKIIFSTGMSTYEEIDQVVEWLNGSEIIMLHCNSTYPAPLEDLNLKCIQTLKERYNCEVGYSGHEFRLGTSVSAVYLGASVIERHITLDRTMWGSDHMSSIEPQGLIKLVKGIRELEIAYGDGIKRVTEGELAPRKKLRGY